MKILDIAPLRLLKQSLDVYSRQHDAIAENVANVNNPDYVRRRTDFSEVLQSVQSGRLRTSSTRHLSTPDPSTRLDSQADKEALDLSTEMADLAINHIRFDFSAQALRRMYGDLMAGISGRSG